MYSFAQRDDTLVVDEPLYAHYLWLSGKDHPGKAEILSTQNNNGKEVVEQVILGGCSKPVLFIKNMAHHFVKLNDDFLTKVTNVFLIRKPSQLIASYAKIIDNPTLQDVGLDKQLEIFEKLNPEDVIVLDSGEVLKDPKTVLATFCKRLQIPFDVKMLSWEAGPRPEDGVWAKYWYTNVHRSTGFAKQKTSSRPFPDHLRPLLEQAQPIYDLFYSKAIKA